ncbi:MAG: MerR family transcriptional regulator [Rickettsiaceae bacterium]|nr:MerR family transcriptional regulator [Rickettsiaceae bacterium]
MAYTVKQLAKVSGVSVRTLHFYDEIGLLKPAYYGSENNYRYYEQAQLLILQQILFYRELGFPLADIQRIIGSDDFNKITALNAHKLILKRNITQTKNLINTIDKTISYLRGNTTMKDTEIFEGFDPKKQKEYEEYLIKTGKASQEDIDKSWGNVKDWNKDNWNKFKSAENDLNKELTQFLQSNLSPGDPKVQALIAQHYQWVKSFWTPDKKSYVGLAELYCESAEFKKYYAAYDPRLAEYLAAAMREFAERNLS